MDDLKLGQIIEAKRQAGRDAVHVAVIPLTASVVLLPGSRVNAEGLPLAPFVGIVDPFLDCVVKPGERFWLWLMPGTVTGIRHHWAHPAFPVSEAERANKAEAAESEAWLRKYAEGFNSYEGPEEAFANLVEGLRTGHLHSHGGTTLNGLYDLDDADELRFHAERYLGIRVNWGGFTFSCSC